MISTEHQSEYYEAFTNGPPSILLPLPFVSCLLCISVSTKNADFFVKNGNDLQIQYNYVLIYTIAQVSETTDYCFSIESFSSINNIFI